MAKSGLKKKYIKLAGGNWAKAWKLQKAAQKKTAKKRKPAKKKVVKRKPVKKKRARKKAPVKKRIVKKSAKKRVYKKKPIKKTLKKGVKRVAKKKKKKTSKRGAPGTAMQKNLMQLAQTGTLTALGAVAAGFLAANVPIKDPRIKSLLPVGAAVVLGMTRIGRGKMMKPVINGLVAASALSMIKQFVPDIPVLAAEDDLLYIPDEELLGQFTPELGGEGFVPELGYVEDFSDPDLMGEWATPGNYM